MAADQMAVTLDKGMALRTEVAVLIQRHLQYHKAPYTNLLPFSCSVKIPQQLHLLTLLTGYSISDCTAHSLLHRS